MSTDNNSEEDFEKTEEIEPDTDSTVAEVEISKIEFDNNTGALDIKRIHFQSNEEDIHRTFEPPHELGVSIEAAQFYRENDSHGKIAKPAVIVEREPSPTSMSVERVTFEDGRGTNYRRSDLSSPSSAEKLIAQAITGEYRYAMLGLILGISSIIGGIILGLNGVAGSTSWTAKVLGLESKINDAAPGVVLFVVGLFFVWITKPKVSMKDLKG